MPEVSAFRGLRYDVAKVGDLSRVVAPPYDVIDAPLQERLYAQSPQNVIRLELNLEQRGDDEVHNRYTRASEFLREWRRAGILHEEDHPALYVYEQSYACDGSNHTRTGFFARVRLERFGEGKIFPHEQTLSGPKADRLKLYESTDTQLSPIFGLYPDPAGAVITAIASARRDRTPLEVTDHLGVVHRLWVVTDQQAHTAAQGMMADKPIFIADGHHRYETGITYRDRLVAGGQDLPRDAPANFCLMALVGMSDPGLTILPTHRLLSGLSGLTSKRLAELVATEFDVNVTGEGVAGARAAWNEISQRGGQDMLAFGTAIDRRWLTARLRSDSTMDRLVPQHSAEWRALGVSILHELVIKQLLADVGTPTVRYVHLLDEVTEDVARRGCDLACLVPPATMEHVETIASQLETMPPKSTYFYPKMLTGLLLNPLK